MNIIKGLALGLAVTGMVSCNQKVERKTSLTTEMDSVSYAIGAYVNVSFKKDIDFDKIDLALFNQAIKEASDSAKVLIEQKDLAPILIAYSKKQAELKNAKYKRTVEEFTVVDESIEVQETESGLKYQVISEGTGEKPTAASTVKVHYHGTNPEGEVFDSSVTRGVPAEFPLNRVIPGWTEGLQLMSVGSRYKLIVPADLAYKDSKPSNGNDIIFIVELFEVK